MYATLYECVSVCVCVCVCSCLACLCENAIVVTAYYTDSSKELVDLLLLYIISQHTTDNVIYVFMYDM